MGLSDQFTKKRLVIGAGIALLAGMAGLLAIDSNYKNQRLGECNSGDLTACKALPKSFQPRIANREHLALPVIFAANKCIENPWYCKDLKGLDLGLLPPDLKEKLDTKIEKRAAAKKKAAAEIAALRKKAAEEKALQATMGDWYYGSPTDDATGKKYKTATIYSENKFNLSSPYDGEQEASLKMRTHPRWGFDAIVRIEKGQILCDTYNNTTVLVRFDDGPAVPYSCGEPADHSSDVVFIRGAEKFEAGMKRAKMAHITLRIYQEGSRTMTFKVNGYDSGKV